MSEATSALQVVVVADLDLLDGDRVVLVDDRQHVELAGAPGRVLGVRGSARGRRCPARSGAPGRPGHGGARTPPRTATCSTDWPTAAAACFSGIERGRSGSLSRARAARDRARADQHDPSPVANRARCRRATRCARRPRPCAGVVTRPLPTFTTIRRTRPSRRARAHGWAHRVGDGRRHSIEVPGDRPHQVRETGTGDGRDDEQGQAVERAELLDPRVAVRRRVRQIRLGWRRRSGAAPPGRPSRRRAPD